MDCGWRRRYLWERPGIPPLQPGVYGVCICGKQLDRMSAVHLWLQEEAGQGCGGGDAKSAYLGEWWVNGTRGRRTGIVMWRKGQDGKHRERGKLSTEEDGYPHIMGTYPQRQQKSDVLGSGPGRSGEASRRCPLGGEKGNGGSYLVRPGRVSEKVPDRDFREWRSDRGGGNSSFRSHGSSFGCRGAP